MMTQGIIYHYTDIPTLALILNSGRIRFNRLDKVFDLSEARTGKGIAFGRFFFVSCWTQDAEESIPLWRLYTRDMAGVRIALPSYPFWQCELEVPEEWNWIKKGSVPSPIPFAEAWTDSYLILTQFLSKKDFGGQVKYTDEIQQVYERSVRIVREGQDTRLSVDHLFDLPRLKAKAWEFEREYRFVLFILPTVPIPPGGPSGTDYQKELINHMLKCLLQGKGPTLDCFDVRLAPEVIDQIAVTLGPCCTRGDRLIIESLLEKYTRNGSVASSKLEGTIRNI